MDNYTLHDIYKMERSFRTNLINSISGIKSANLIGTSNSEGLTNLAVFNSVMHIGANPPLLSIFVRPHKVERHTYENIKSTGYFTINAVNKSLLERAHLTSGKFAKEVSEFLMCDIKPSFSDVHPAPYVEESPIQIGLRMEEEYHINANQTILVIGRIIEIIFPKDGFGKDGQLAWKDLNLLGINGLSNYCEPSTFKSMPYVRKESIQSS